MADDAYNHDDKSYDIEMTELPYRPNVGILVFNDAGKVFVGRRLADFEYQDAHYVWQMPQGGIDEGEIAESAARRELYEETGMTSVCLLRETADWLYYDLPKDKIGTTLGGKFRGQKQKWFAYHFMGDESEIILCRPGEEDMQEFSDWRWVELDELAELAVPFKRGIYEQVVEIFRPYKP